MSTKKQTDKIQFDDAVELEKTLVAAIKTNKMRLGELAECVETDHGEKKLEKWAAEIGVSYESVKRYRSTYRKYKDANFGETSPSTGVLQALENHPKRDEIIAEFPDLTVRAARTLASDHRKANGHDTTAEVDATDITDATTAVERTPATTTNGIQKKKSRHARNMAGWICAAVEDARKDLSEYGPETLTDLDADVIRERRGSPGDRPLAADRGQLEYVRGYYGKAVRAAA